MENKIVYLKTYITTIIVLILASAAIIGGGIYYYENKIKTLEKELNEQKTNNTGITIVEDFENIIGN